MFTQRFVDLIPGNLERIHFILPLYITNDSNENAKSSVSGHCSKLYESETPRYHGYAKIRKYTTMQFAASICSLYASNLNCGFRQSPCFSWRQFNERASSTIPTSGKYPRSLPTRTAKLAYYSPMTSSSLFPPSFRSRRCPLLPVLFPGSRNTVVPAAAAIAARNGGCELSERSDTTASRLLQPSSNLSRG